MPPRNMVSADSRPSLRAPDTPGETSVPGSGLQGEGTNGLPQFVQPGSKPGLHPQSPYSWAHQPRSFMMKHVHTDFPRKRRRVFHSRRPTVCQAQGWVPPVS